MPNRPNSINEEAGLGENWVPVDAPPIVPGRSNPAPPPPPGTLVSQSPQYLQGSIPPAFQHDTSFVDTATLTPSAPKFSLMPLGVTGNPVSNAAVQSTAVASQSKAPTVALFYQTVQLAGGSLPQRTYLNILAPLTAVDDAGNNSTDIGIVTFGASGPSHSRGAVPDPGGSAGTTHFLREDATWDLIDLTADVTGVLPVANGGTGDSSLTAHELLVGRGTSPVAVIPIGTAGQLLTSNGAGSDPSFQAAPVTVNFALDVNTVGVSLDKQIYINAVVDGSTKAWVVQVNGAAA